MARAAVDARKSQVNLEISKLFPDIGLGLSAKWAYAPEITDQTNPFVRDNGNFLYFAAGLLVKYKLDFVPQSARISQAKSQLNEMLATEQWAKSGIAQQVTDAYAEVRETEKRLLTLHEATKLAKQWLVKVQQGIEVGTMDEADIVLPAKEYAFKRFAEMSAVYDYNVALARLSQTTGVGQILSSNQ
jgi:outer membrane protein TolC